MNYLAPPSVPLLAGENGSDNGAIRDADDTGNHVVELTLEGSWVVFWLIKNCLWSGGSLLSDSSQRRRNTLNRGEETKGKQGCNSLKSYIKVLKMRKWPCISFIISCLFSFWEYPGRFSWDPSLTVFSLPYTTLDLTCAHSSVFGVVCKSLGNAVFTDLWNCFCHCFVNCLSTLLINTFIFSFFDGGVYSRGTGRWQWLNNQWCNASLFRTGSLPCT